MYVTELAIYEFRNFLEANIRPCPEINIFYGDNGAGKTSILEALYFLGLGRSFRTHLTQRVIRHGADHFTVFAKLSTLDGQAQALGIERSRQGEKKIRINSETVTSLATLAKLMPLLLLTTESYRYFHDGPKLRRQFLDFGVFHVEPYFHSHWLQFQTGLRQRNACLKMHYSAKETLVWDNELELVSTRLDQYRREYVEKLLPILKELLSAFLPEFDFHLRYTRGWAADKSLMAVLVDHFARDQQLGYTQFGPQRADLQLYVGKLPAGDFLSQGQQKLAAYALYLAQGMLLKIHASQNPIYLIDDLPSELDFEKRRLVGAILTELNSQVFITGITRNELFDMITESQTKMFHVKHNGVIES